VAIYELRTYELFPHNREWLHERFRAHTTKIFERLGLPAVGFWSVTAGPGEGDLVYLMRWESYEQREAGWKAFGADPEWQEIRALTNKEHGPLVARTHCTLLVPTDYSPQR
jgi:hypothetical protein